MFNIIQYSALISIAYYIKFNEIAHNKNDYYYNIISDIGISFLFVEYHLQVNLWIVVMKMLGNTNLILYNTHRAEYTSTCTGYDATLIINNIQFHYDTYSSVYSSPAEIIR